MSAPQILDRDECQTVLERALKTTNFELTSFKILNFSNPLQGLVCDHFILRLEYSQEKPQTQVFFVKTLSENPVLREISETICIYEKEKFFYELLVEFGKYNIDTTFAPRGYLFTGCTIVLEDLSGVYQGTPKRKLLDLEHCRCCLGALAKLHASGLIYQRSKSQELSTDFLLDAANFDILADKFATDEETIATRWMTSAVIGVLELINLVPANGVAADVFKEKILAAESDPKSLISGVLHGDLWTSNFLYKYKDGKPTECKIVDYQLLKYGPLELDVAEFLTRNISRILRDQYYDSLVEHYYDSLSKCLARASLEETLPDKCDFVQSCNNFKVVGKLHALVDHSYTFLPDEVYAHALNSEESFRKFLFEERGAHVVESYSKDEEFRNMLLEDVLELRDLLFS